MNSFKFEILDVEQLEAVLENKKSEQEMLHLLLGNGFSIGYSEEFSYNSLFELAKINLSPRLTEVFKYLGINNFEGVLKYLRILLDIQQIYINYTQYSQANKDLADDFELLKHALVDTITNIHPAYEQFSIEPIEDKLNDQELPWVNFFKKFENIFTTNYDLILYWIVIGRNLVKTIGDGFAKHNSLDGRLEWSENAYLRAINIYYLHGALHIYKDEEGRIFKRTSRSTERLLEQIKNGIQEKKFPIFVTEGLADKKRQQIESNRYLLHCYTCLEKHVKGTLVVFGHSLQRSDDHILEAICKNEGLTEIWIGVYGNFNYYKLRKEYSLLYDRIVEKRMYHHAKKPFRIGFYDSSTKNFWGAYSRQKLYKQILLNKLEKVTLKT